jgi:hypothetical protein
MKKDGKWIAVHLFNYTRDTNVHLLFSALNFHLPARALSFAGYGYEAASLAFFAGQICNHFSFINSYEAKSFGSR